jgi:tetratricopeptide (TPR) repeat protein
MFIVKTTVAVMFTGLFMASARLFCSQDPSWNSALAAEKDGKLEVAIQKYLDAEKEFSSAKGKSDAANNVGLVHLKERKWDEAFKDFERALSYAQTPHALNNWGSALIRYYQCGKGSVGDLKKAQELYASLEKIDPEYRKENRQAVKDLLDTAQKEADLAKLEGAGGEAKDSWKVPDQGDYKAYEDAGDKALGECNYKKAEACFQRMIQQAQSDKARSNANNRLGLSFIRARQHLSAVTPLEQAVALDPDNKAAWGNLGHACKQLFLMDDTASWDLLKRAKEAFEKAGAQDGQAWAEESLKQAPQAQAKMDAEDGKKVASAATDSQAAEGKMDPAKPAIAAAQAPAVQAGDK